MVSKKRHFIAKLPNDAFSVGKAKNITAINDKNGPFVKQDNLLIGYGV